MISITEFYEKYCKVNGNKPKLSELDKQLLNAIESGKKVHIVKGRTGTKYILA